MYILASKIGLFTFAYRSLNTMTSHWIWVLGLIPVLGRSCGEGKGYPLQYSGLENPMDSIVRHD